MFAVVTPKEDCPHHVNLNSQDIIANIKHNHVLDKNCLKCELEGCVTSSNKENWLCLSCKEIFCSRYCHGHMEMHYFDKRGNNS